MSDDVVVDDFSFLIVRPDNGGLWDLFKFLVFNNLNSGAKFLESSESDLPFPEVIFDDDEDVITLNRRWVIVVSIIARKVIKVLGKPLEWIGYIVEFLLNLLSLNGQFRGLIQKILQGNVIMPKRGSATFISAIGHLDGRIDLFNADSAPAGSNMGNRELMDLSIMASTLAYENAVVVRNVVNLHWKMHFVDFYNCWNGKYKMDKSSRNCNNTQLLCLLMTYVSDYQKERSTQVFIMCDKQTDADLILISFRGTEPFDADDWITDFDYSWYEIPQLGKVHMGFLEALGLGSRIETSSFQNLLRVNAESSIVITASARKELVPVGEKTAYHTVRTKLKELLEQHKNAKFVVTGHSLGGALAILLPTVLVLHGEEETMQRLLGVYTFGQPRVCNRKLGRFMENRLEYYRVVYCNDLVPRLPYDDRTFLYKHFGKCLYYDSLYVEQSVREEPNKNYFNLRYLVSDYLNAAWELFRSLTMSCMFGSEYKESWESTILRLVGLVIPGLSAHSPVDYVNSVRLGRAGSAK